MDDLYPGIILWFSSVKGYGVLADLSGVNTYLFDVKPLYNSARVSEPLPSINQVDGWTPRDGEFVYFSIRFWTTQAGQDKFRVTSIAPAYSKDFAIQDRELLEEYLEMFKASQKRKRSRKQFVDVGEDVD